MFVAGADYTDTCTVENCMGERVCGSREYDSLPSILFDISYIGHRGVQQRGPFVVVKCFRKQRYERLRSVFGGCLLVFLFSFFLILILAFSFSSLLSNLEEKRLPFFADFLFL